MVITLVIGLQFVFVATPWPQTYTAVYAAFFGVFGESAIIDSNHWRHYFRLLGLAWRLMTASRSYLAFPLHLTRAPGGGARELEGGSAMLPAIPAARSAASKRLDLI
jgi:hypothetical protein